MKTNNTLEAYKERLAKYNPNDYPLHVYSQIALCLMYGEDLRGSGSFVAASKEKDDHDS